MGLPRMSLHIGDYKKDTGHLRAAGHGAYLLLIMHYWATGALPDDDRQLAAIACMSDREWKQLRPLIRPFFGPAWSHKRIEAELADAKERYERRASAGKKGGRPPGREKQCESNAFPDRKQPRTLTQKKEGGGGDADARDPLVSAEAMGLADEIMDVFGIDRAFVPPGWCGAPMRIQAGLNTGWRREIIVLAARKVFAAKRDGPPDSFTYLEKPIAREHALAAQPLPTVIIDQQPQQVIHAQADQRHPGGAYGASKDRFREAHAALKASIAADDERQEGGGSVVEFLPAARRQ